MGTGKRREEVVVGCWSLGFTVPGSMLLSGFSMLGDKRFARDFLLN